MASNYEKILYRDYEALMLDFEKLQGVFTKEHTELTILRSEFRLSLKREEEERAKNAELEKQLQAALKEIARLHAVQSINSTNSGIPTAQTPINQQKHIPNSREATGKAKGGQPGHPRRKLDKFKDAEITDHIQHAPKACPYCGGEVDPIDDEITKDETGFEFVVVKRRHHFPNCKCKKCGRTSRLPVPNDLKEENQYGKEVQSIALGLHNVGNVPVGKVKRIIYGLSEGDINPSEGFLIQLQRRAALSLAPFMAELKKKVIQLPLLYWDDTVIYVNTERSCMRFYGNEKLAMFVAHPTKGKIGLDEDGILKSLPAETKVMHDHNMVNYNAEYSFFNIECNEHLLRDLQKVTDNLKRNWSENMKALIQEAMHDRDQQSNSPGFEEAYTKAFFRKLDDIMAAGINEHKNAPESYYYQQELNLLTRIVEYKANYFSWLMDFNLPTTNNESERSLRGVKSHMKISGQFQTIEYAEYYSTIRSYMETCRRNGLNELEALHRLCCGNPFTFKEIIGQTGDAE